MVRIRFPWRVNPDPVNVNLNLLPCAPPPLQRYSETLQYTLTLISLLYSGVFRERAKAEKNKGKGGGKW